MSSAPVCQTAPGTFATSIPPPPRGGVATTLKVGSTTVSARAPAIAAAKRATPSGAWHRAVKRTMPSPLPAVCAACRRGSRERSFDRDALPPLRDRDGTRVRSPLASTNRRSKRDPGARRRRYRAVIPFLSGFAAGPRTTAERLSAPRATAVLLRESNRADQNASPSWMTGMGTQISGSAAAARQTSISSGNITLFGSQQSS